MRIGTTPVGILVAVLAFRRHIITKPRLPNLSQELHERSVIVVDALVGLEPEIGKLGNRGIFVG